MAQPAHRQVRPEWEQEERERDELIARYIQPHPHEPGRANAYLPDRGCSVARIVRDLQAGDGIVNVAATWDLPEDAVHAVIAFYYRNRAIIDARLLLEDDEWDPDFTAS